MRKRDTFHCFQLRELIIGSCM